MLLGKNIWKLVITSSVPIRNYVSQTQMTPIPEDLNAML